MKNMDILRVASELPLLTGKVDNTNTAAHSDSMFRQTSGGGERATGRLVKPEEDFRGMLRLRETAPFVSAIPYRRWGINE